MAASRTEKGLSSGKVEGKRPSNQDDLLCKIKSYLIACKTPADDWQSIKETVEQGVGFPDVQDGRPNRRKMVAPKASRTNRCLN